MSFEKHARRLSKGLAHYRVAPELTAQAIESFLFSLDHPRALTVWLLYRENEHNQLANLAFDPLDYNSVSSVRAAYCATKFLSKFKDLNLGYDLDKVALEKFKKFELLCQQTNIRFHDLSCDPLFKGPHVYLHNAVVRKIERLLGEFNMEEFVSSPDWGPGATTKISRRDASAQEKFQCETGITRDLHALFPWALFGEYYPKWALQLQVTDFPSFEVGNRVITVPKDATANRVIAVEPGINLWFQKSLGRMIKRRLLRVGVDLTRQNNNSESACLGSKTGELATVDLSSASDSIASAVVEAVLPPQWFRLLDLCRTRYGKLDSEMVRWEKFSSMGNGFTFPLQSLIFYAVACCCTEYLKADVESVRTYGDDVIIPTSVFELFSAMVNFYGFVVNKKKSHYCSPFRESCGGHFYAGVDIKPIYLKGNLTSALAIYRLANRVRDLSHRWMNNLACDFRFKDTIDRLIAKMPEALRLRVPLGVGDGGFISNLDEATPSRARFGIEGYRYIHAGEVGVNRLDERNGYLLAELWRLSKRDRITNPIEDVPFSPSAILKPLFPLSRVWEYLDDVDLLDSGVKGRNTVPSRDLVIKVSVGLVRQWYDLGPWLGL